MAVLFINATKMPLSDFSATAGGMYTSYCPSGFRQNCPTPSVMEFSMTCPWPGGSSRTFLNFLALA